MQRITRKVSESLTVACCIVINLLCDLLYTSENEDAEIFRIFWFRQIELPHILIVYFLRNSRRRASVLRSQVRPSRRRARGDACSTTVDRAHISAPPYANTVASSW